MHSDTQHNPHCSEHTHDHEHSTGQPGHTYPQGHDHAPRHGHNHHEHCGHKHHHHGHHGKDGHAHDLEAVDSGTLLVIRPFTGMAGDIMAAGLAGLLGADQQLLDSLVAAIGIPELAPGSFAVAPHMVNEVSGLIGRVSLPHEHAHRTFKDIRAIIRASTLEDPAKDLAEKAFRLIAEAEAAVHGKDIDEVRFHEVGALDSILDICLGAALFTHLAPQRFICGPLPLCDGVIHCAHGQIPAPAPAVLHLLHGVPVRGIPGAGETVTPTGLALLKAFGAEFGPWPAFTLERECLAYGNRVFPDTPNGAIFAFGSQRIAMRRP